MPSTSNASVYHAHTPQKPQHFFTTRPPTAHAVDNQSLRAYSLSSYSQDSHRPLMASTQSAKDIEAAHQQRVEQQIRDILSRFNGH
ncbi:hypothetical protein F4777DRAFT_582118 [Nemania sp. FL0916]|nr:hypothetical protein F4777DRAFT_582118 [Nemania sp. FL0916]